MSKVCEVTGRKTTVGNSRSKAMNATRREFRINLHKHRFWVPEAQKFITLRLSTHAMKIIDRRGIEYVLKKIGRSVH